MDRRTALKWGLGLVAGAAANEVPAWMVGGGLEGRVDQRAAAILKLQSIGDSKIAYAWASCEAYLDGAYIFKYGQAAKLMNHYLYGDGSAMDLSRDINLMISKTSYEDQFWKRVGEVFTFNLTKDPRDVFPDRISPQKFQLLHEKKDTGYFFTVNVGTLFGVNSPQGMDWQYALGSSTGSLICKGVEVLRDEVFLTDPILRITDRYVYHRQLRTKGIISKINEVLFQQTPSDLTSKYKGSFREKITKIMVEIGQKEQELFPLLEKDFSELDKAGLAHPFDVVARIEKKGKLRLGKLVA